jgi:glycerate-2-kinase
MIERQLAEEVFHDAVRDCDASARVARALTELKPDPTDARDVFAVAVGKAAVRMARGVGPVSRGFVLATDSPERASPRNDIWIPRGWSWLPGPHPEPTADSVASAHAIRELVEDALDLDVVIACVSGGASAQLEEPRVPLDELVAIVRALTAAGAPIRELNTVRGALSSIKAGGLVTGCAARVITLIASDVIGDPIDVVGSGPTVGPWLDGPGIPVDIGAAADARRRAAIAILERHGVPVPAVLERPIASRIVTRNDHAIVVLPMAAFADAAVATLAAREVRTRRLDPPYEGDAIAIADRLAAERGPIVGWGEATVRLPPGAGAGGRSQHLALALAKRLRGGNRSALVAGTDGVDGPAPPGRTTSAAGAFVDGRTWDAIRAAGIDPDGALARCDSFAALDRVSATFWTGPTGVNHADIAIIG